MVRSYPKLSRQEVRARNALLQLLQEKADLSRISSDINQALKEYTRADVTIAIDILSSVQGTALPSNIAKGACLCAIGVLAKPYICVLEIDGDLARQLTYAILGVDSTDATNKQPLTDIENGIFSFALAKVLEVIAKSLQSAASPLAVLGVSDALDGLPKDTASPFFISINFFTTFSKTKGHCRLLIPSNLIDAFGAQNMESNLQLAFTRAAGVELPVTLYVGQVRLSPQDINALDVDDIVVLEGAHIKLNKGVVTAKARGSVGADNELATFTGDIEITAQNTIRIKVSDATLLSRPVAKNTLLNIFDDGAT